MAAAATALPLATEVQVQVFKALGHPARLAMVLAVAEGERCVCELTDLAGLDISTISRHLSVLKAAGILADERRGNRIFYRLRLPCVLNLMRCLETAGDRCGGEVGP